MESIAVIGCGNIGIAIVEGLLKTKSDVKIIATKPNLSSIQFLCDKGVELTTNNTLAVQKSQIVIIAVKPYRVIEVVKEIQPALTKNHILISVASEIKLAAISNLVGNQSACFRVMPNTAAGIGESITCISTHNANQNQTQKVQYIFSSIGETSIISEELMEAATILGACGIAYVLRFIRAMIQGGIQIGFSSETATQITLQTVKGAAELLIQNKNHPEQEIDKVTTPKGCTITGLNEMEHQGFSSSLIKGIVKSYEKIETQ